MAQATTTEPEAPSTNAADIVTLNRDDLAKLMQSAADQAVAKLRAQEQGNAAPKVMQAKVGDTFFKRDHRRQDGEPIKQYRIDGPQFMATKIMELDMERLRHYEQLLEDGELDDYPHDREGFPRSPRTLANMKGKFISCIGGKIAARTQNQVEMLEWLKTQPLEEGGLPGLYEVTEESYDWLCNTCQPARPFKNKQDWEAHREATHGIPRSQAA